VDSNAAWVWDENREHLVGYVPATVKDSLNLSPSEHHAIVIAEDLSEGRRWGLVMLISRAPVTLVVIDKPEVAVRRLVAKLPRIRPVSHLRPRDDPIDQMAATLRMIEQRRAAKPQT
jgi:hypothetical protein